MRKTLSAQIGPVASSAPPTTARLDRLHERARGLRRNLTEAEGLLWSRLSNAQLGGIKFSPKAVVGSAIVDFACAARWMVVSITSPGVNPEVDALQDRKMTEEGIRVLRFSESAVLEGLDDVVRTITAMTNAPFEKPGAGSDSGTGSAARGGRN